MPTLGDGQIFERYRIIRWLGSGIAGESYEAEDRSLLRKVTLKLIHPWSTLPDSARRQFFREMQGISTLNHPYLATVLDYGEIDGRIYVARRYVSSGSLLGTNGRAWFSPPLPLADAFKYAHQLARILQYIHQHGYLHGALTFSNVLVLRGPNSEQETDYAPFLLADIGLTNFVRRFGSPRVEALPVSAAPEQLGKRVTPASDQFALAVLLYFWLAGRPPYLGEPDEIEQLKLTETITPLTTLNPGVTNEQDGIIQRALTARPEARHSSVLNFAEALIESLASTPQSRPALGNLFPEEPETPRELLDSPLPFPQQAPAFWQRVEPAREKDTNGQANLPTQPPTSAVPTNEEPVRARSTQAEQTAPDQAPRSTELENGASLVEADSTTPPASSAAPVTNIPETPHLEQQEATQTTSDGMASSTIPVSTSQPGTEEPLNEHVPANQQTVRVEHATSPISEPGPEQPATTAPGDEMVTSVNGITASSTTERTNNAGKAATSQPANQDTPAPRLLISSPYSNSTSEFLLTSEEISVGRAGSSDLLLDYDNLTSRHHALLRRIGEHTLIFDKRSNNGVFINGQRIEVEQGYELADGDHISIGSYELIFRVGQSNNDSQPIS